ncbi:MAG: DUF1800 domain-containing protein, partial [Acidobacteriota bacterium]|nr:DUF1800 domain-containing protein [Acidobacteriota bacterium]
MKQKFTLLSRFAAILMIAAMLSPVLALPTGAESEKKVLTEDQKILHVLNRLGFGARPGDVEKVKAFGLQKYIDQQINGIAINDATAENKVKNIEIFNMTTAEVFAKYPNPGALLRRLEGRNRNSAAPVQMNSEKMPEQAGQNGMTQDERRERQQKLQKLYREYDLKPANQLVPQIAANRVLRAVYSERQLQEVMVDFWQNHFNVFSGKNAVRWYI